MRMIVCGVFLLASTALAAQTLVSVQEEIEIGQAANKQMRAQVPVLTDSRVAGYVRDVGTRLVRVAPGPKYPYSFSVAAQPEINAFSLPGGPIWINQGVLQRAANESQVAAVLAHEIAHIAKRHGANRLTQGMVAKWGLGLLGALLGNAGGASSARAAASVITGGVFLSFTRNEEREADQVGLAVLTRAGWSGRGMVELFEMIGREKGRKQASVDAFLSSHPAADDRIKNLAAAVARARDGRRDSGRFREVKAHLTRGVAAHPLHNR